MRTDGRDDFLFLLNFQPAARKVNLGHDIFTDIVTDKGVKGTVTLAAYGTLILRRPHAQQAS